MPFAPQQTTDLDAPLLSKHVAERSQSGRKLSYIEGWHAIAEANRIFGHHAWARQTDELRLVSEREVTLSSGAGFSVSYVARVRITVTTPDGDMIIRDGTGAGHGKDKDLGLAHESASKEAETDAMKRALMTFGNPFGLALYDKTQSNVASYDSAAIEQFKKELAAARDLAGMDQVVLDYTDAIVTLRNENLAEWQVLNGLVKTKKKELTDANGPA